MASWRQCVDCRSRPQTFRHQVSKRPFTYDDGWIVLGVGSSIAIVVIVIALYLLFA